MASAAHAATRTNRGLQRRMQRFDAGAVLEADVNGAAGLNGEGLRERQGHVRHVPVGGAAFGGEDTDEVFGKEAELSVFDARRVEPLARLARSLACRQPQKLDQRFELGWNLNPAGVIEKQPGKR
jgi:hypothetical protein